MTHVMEQLEVDWKYSYGVQTADNELLARIIVKEIFRLNGLEVSFQAKPVPALPAAANIPTLHCRQMKTAKLLTCLHRKICTPNSSLPLVMVP